MNTELVKAIDLIVEEKGISKDFIYDALESALASAYKKNFDSKTNVRVDINKDNGEIKVFSVLHVVDEISEEDEEKDSKILLPDAQKMVPGITVGETIETEVTPKDFGRVATSTAKQVVTQKIREAERASIIDEFADKQDELMVGMLAMEDAKNAANDESVLTDEPDQDSEPIEDVTEDKDNKEE